MCPYFGFTNETSAMRACGTLSCSCKEQTGNIAVGRGVAVLGWTFGDLRQWGKRRWGCWAGQLPQGLCGQHYTLFAFLFICLFLGHPYQHHWQLKQETLCSPWAPTLRSPSCNGYLNIHIWCVSAFNLPTEMQRTCTPAHSLKYVPLASTLQTYFYVKQI